MLAVFLRPTGFSSTSTGTCRLGTIFLRMVGGIDLKLPSSAVDRLTSDGIAGEIIFHTIGTVGASVLINDARNGWMDRIK